MTTACLPKIMRFLTALHSASQLLKSHDKKPLRPLTGWKSMPNTGLALLPSYLDACHAQIGKRLLLRKYALPCVPPSTIKVKMISNELHKQLMQHGITTIGEVALREALEARAQTYTLIKLAPSPPRRWNSQSRQP